MSRANKDRRYYTWITKIKMKRIRKKIKKVS